jgi:hypothetical protein
MFRAAYAIAREFTFPVILSRKTIGGQCFSSIGAFVVVNRDGWIVTAGHVIDDLAKMIDEEKQVRAAAAQREQIRNDPNLDHKQKKKGIAGVKRHGDDATEECSGWWSWDHSQITMAHVIPDVDLAIAKLEPFDPAWVKRYPLFKDPNGELAPGTNLCRVGYQFSSVVATWDAGRRVFSLPQTPSRYRFSPWTEFSRATFTWGRIPRDPTPSGS